MKILLKLTLVLLVLNIFQSCSKDDAPTPEPIAQPEPMPEPEPENQAPTQVSLLAPASDAENIDVRPTFNWEAATDPDGDAITYEIYADTTATPATLIGATSEISFELEERLSLLENYNWKVIAKDVKGGESSSVVQNFDTRSVIASIATTIAPFGRRIFHSTAVFNDKVWVIGGNEKELGNQNDIWNSIDGVNWVLVTGAANFTPRSAHKSVVFDNKLWVLGGFVNGSGFTREVWNTENGVNWNLVNADAGVDIRDNTSVLTYDNKMWIIGDEVWFSEDGVIWSLAQSNLPFNNSSATVFDNKMWVVGGNSTVHYSEDGFNWTEIEPNPNSEWENIDSDDHRILVFDNKIWDVARGGKITLFSSTDGIDWQLVSDSTGITAQLFYETAVKDEKIWVIGGTAPGGVNNFQDDVWFID